MIKTTDNSIVNNFNVIKVCLFIQEQTIVENRIVPHINFELLSNTIKTIHVIHIQTNL